MKKNRRIPIAVSFAGLLVFAALFADFLSPNPPDMQNLDQFFHPPSRVHIFDHRGGLKLRPFIYKTELTDPLNVTYGENPGAAYPLEFFFRGYPYRLLGLIPLDRHLVGRSGQPYYYPLGTDELGRDVTARVLAGTRTSLLVVVLGMAIYAALGLTIGASAGLFGGWMDALLMRFSEFVLALPALYLALALRALMPLRIPFWQTLLLTVGTIASVAWPPMARGIRGLILQLKNSMHIEAARSLGSTPMQIFRRHMLPALLPYALTQTAVAAPVFLLGEAVLSFLNVGFRDSGESWGSMLRSLKDIRVITDFWWNLLPLLMVFLTLLCLNVFSGRLGRREPDSQIMRI
jgi:peptide/nickel transport system permease protein